MNNTMILEFPSPESARDFIEDVDHNDEFRPKVNFLLSVGQRLALRKLKRAENRPNETGLNYQAFLVVLLSGAILFVVLAILSSWQLLVIELASFGIGILIATLSGAVAALGLPTKPESINRLKRIRLNCDDSITKPLSDFAKKY